MAILFPVSSKPRNSTPSGNGLIEPAELLPCHAEVVARGRVPRVEFQNGLELTRGGGGIPRFGQHEAEVLAVERVLRPEAHRALDERQALVAASGLREADAEEMRGLEMVRAARKKLAIDLDGLGEAAVPGEARGSGQRVHYCGLSPPVYGTGFNAKRRKLSTASLKAAGVSK
jgi:hypothetical protein